MRIAVFGAGGVGGYFGSKISEAGIDVVFIARGKHLQAMRQSGLQLDSPEGNTFLPSVQATDDAREAGIADTILLCVKTWQVPEALEKMQPMIAPETVVIPLLNGVEAPEQLSAVLGGKHVFGVLRGLPETRQLLEQALSECVRVGQARHVLLSDSLTTGVLADLDSMSPAATTSMQRDIRDGRPSELDAQSGTIVRLGEKAGVETPVHRFVYHALLPNELRARGKIEF